MFFFVPAKLQKDLKLDQKHVCFTSFGHVLVLDCDGEPETAAASCAQSPELAQAFEQPGAAENILVCLVPSGKKVAVRLQDDLVREAIRSKLALHPSSKIIVTPPNPSRGRVSTDLFGGGGFRRQVYDTVRRNAPGLSWEMEVAACEPAKATMAEADPADPEGRV
mmetsp:Transcript_67967/g.159901  ORF Transcript_67967/g.159901 Transcript_67967/m.159901 type:complete len:165 (-) Transcript_67967:34-528(-)